MSERDIQAEVQIAASQGGHRLFRINSGMAWAGRVVNRTPTTITLANYRPVHLAPEGTSDLIGWTNAGRFLAAEIKVPGHKTNADRLAAQLKFISAVNAAGGVAGMVTSVDEFRSLVNPSK